MPVSADAFLDEKKLSADAFLDEESDRPPERLEPDLTEPIPRPSVGATGTWEEESPEQRRIRTAVDLFAARKEGDVAQREAESLGEQYRSIERFTPSGILNQPERFARALAAPNAPEIPERFQPGQPIFPIPEPTGTNAMAGLGQLGVQTLNALQTPEMIVTAPAAANPVGRALFAADMGRHIPEQVEQGAQVIGDIESTPAQKVVAGGTPVIAGTMTALLGKSEIPRPVIAERVIAKTEAAVPGALSKAKAALADTAKREPISDQVQQLETVIEKGVPDEAIQVQEAQGPKEVLSDAARVKEIEAELIHRAARRGRFDAPDPRMEALRAEKLVLEAGREAAQPVAEQLVKGGNKITKETVPERVAVQAEQVMENGETVPGYVTIQSKGNAQSGPVEVWRAAGHEIPDTAGLPSGTYTVAELKARANEKAIPAATEAATPAAADQTQVPTRRAPVVEPRVGAVPENVSGAGAATTPKYLRDYKPGDVVQFGDKAIEIVKQNKTSTVVNDPASNQKGLEISWSADTKNWRPNPKPLPEPAGQIKAGEELPVPAASQATYTAGAKVLADKLRAQFKTETGGKTFTGPVEIINAAVEIAAKIIEYGGSAVDALAAGLKHIRQHSPVDEAAFRSRFDEAFKAAAPKQERATLDDVYKIFEPAPRESKGITARAGEAVESFRTGFSSKFRPLNKLAEDIAAKGGGQAKDIAGIFEQLKGSSGKAEADVYRFDRDVSDVVKGSEKDFNAYVFLRRSLDRLTQDAADIARAQAGENVPNLNRRRVSQYTIPQLEAKLAVLSEQIGGEKLAQFTKAAEAFQTHMDQALRLQMDSGRMSPEVYDAIKSGNQFYAPFKVMKYIEDTMRPEGSGRKVDTTADFVKAMEGIEDPNFKLGDMLSAARQNLTLSRTLAEKNRAMQNITELAALDVDGNFVQKLKPGAEAPRGMEAVNVMESGVKERYAVNEDVAQAVQNAGPGLPAGIVARWSSNLFRAGATTLNVAFQPVNLLFADAPRAALVSKYGVKGVTDLVRYPMDFVESLFSSIAGDVFGVKNKLFQDFLDSGAAGTTVQQYLTPEALRFKPETATSKTKAIAKTALNTIPQFANAIEQTSKVLGVKRAMRIEGAESGAALAKQIPEAITEIRRFSGSPDFGRAGKWTDQYRLNLVYMFLNARIQGAVADVGRLTGRDGGSRAAKTWLKMGTAVGLPTAYLYMLNNSDEYKEDYAKRPEQEKQNYWLIPKDTFITGANGEKMRDYWRVPKREIAQWMGNAVESGLDFANQRDPKAFWKWAEGMAESIAPVNIRGNTLQERGESVLSGTHPFIKAPIETFSGRDTYRHKPIVSDVQKKASPKEQYDERTPDVFKSLADKMPDVAPEVFRSPKMLENLTKNFTAGLLTQFLPRQPVEGRSKAENLPLAQRFQAVPYTDSSGFDQRIQKFERESADEQLKRMRDAKAIMDANKGAKPDVLIKQMIEKHGRDPKMAERIVDMYLAEQRGITPQERRVLALPVTQRAQYLAAELKGKTPEQKSSLLRNWGLKRILTERVGAELAPLIKPPTPNPNP